MQISISSIKDRQGSTLPFKFSMTPDQFQGVAEDIELLTPVDVRGDVTNTGSAMLVKARVRSRVRLQCSRCLQSVLADVEATIEERYRPSDPTGRQLFEDPLAEDDDVGYYERDRIDLGEVVRENFALQIPMKPICADSCRGLCPQCGINLNDAACSCKQDDIDPRLAALYEWKARHGSSD